MSTTTPAGHIPAITGRLAAFLAHCPEEAPQAATEPAPGHARDLPPPTGVPARYAAEWTRPTDPAWRSMLARVSTANAQNGITTIVGNRGTGKTRLAIEAMRDLPERERDRSTYTTAMSLFIRVRASFNKGAKESEADIVRDLSRVPLLIIDELQERGDTPWEDRLLTHIIDARYGAMRPTILVANLHLGALAEHLGPSIVDRMAEAGGVIEVAGTSYRRRQP